MSDFGPTAYLILLSIAFLLNLITLGIAWPRRILQGGTMLIVMLATVGMMLVATGLSMVSPDVELALFWHFSIRLAFFGVIGPMVLLFVLQYLDYRPWQVQWRQWLLFAVPAISISLLWTNSLHHLFALSYNMVRLGSYFVRAGWTPGVWFFVHAVYSYITLIAALALVIIEGRQRTGPFKQQMWLIVAAICPAVLLSMIDTLQLLPQPGFQLSPFGLAVMGPLLTIALTRHRLLDLIPPSFHLVMDVMTDLVVVVDTHHQIVHMNKAALTTFGLNLDQAVGHKAGEVLSLWKDVVDQLAKSEEIHTDSVLSVKNVLRTYELNILGIHNPRGHLVGRVIVAHDISDRQRAIEETRKLSRAVEFSPSVVVITDVQGRIEYVNPKFSELTGYEPGEVIGQNPRILKSGFTSAQEYRKLWDVVSSGDIWRGEFKNRKKDGSTYWEMASISSVKNEKGAVTHFVKVAEDITKRKDIEEALKSQLEAEQDFQNLLMALHEITIELTRIDNLDDFYKRAIELGLERLGYERLGLLLYDRAQECAIGTYGTDVHGSVVAEHHLHFDPGNLTSILRRAVLSEGRSVLDEAATLFSNFEPVGTGWNAVAVLWNGTENTGWLAADNLIEHKPITKSGLDMLSLYAMTLGALLAQRQTRIALQRSEEQFRALLESAPDAVVIVNPIGEIVLVNAQTERLFRYSREELIGRPVENLIPAQLRNLHIAHRASYETEPHIREMGGGLDLYALRKDSSQFPVEIRLSPIEAMEGTLVASSIRDITERKRTDMAIAQLAAIVASSNDAIYSATLDGIVTTWNHGAERMFGFIADEMVGQSLQRIIPEGELERISDLIAAIRRGEPIETFETQRMRKDGQRIEVALTVSYIRDKRDQIIEISIFARDVSQRKRELQELEQALLKAEEANRLKSQFLGMMSHELRTPLNAVIGFSDLLLAGAYGDLNDSQRDFLNDILSNGDHLLALINQLLDLSSIEAGKLTITSTVIKPGEILERMRNRLLPLAAQKGLEFNTYLDPGLPPTLIGDSLRLEQIMNNLLGNAFKFTQEGSVQLRIERVNGSNWTITVIDTGVGISAEAQEYIFDEFRQGDTSIRRSYGGTGLGLAITRQLVLLMGGMITVQSKLGRGSTFTVRLPLVMTGQESKDNARDIIDV